MPGIGGKALSYKNAIETAHVINEIDPDYVRIRTAVIKREQYYGNTLKAVILSCAVKTKN